MTRSMLGRLFAVVALTAYGAVLIRLLVFKNVMFTLGPLRFRFAARSGDFNLTPFRSIGSYLRGEHGLLIGVVNLGGNIILFAPIGFFVPLIVRRVTWPTVLGLGIAAGLAIEGLQTRLQLGEFDIDDLILNALGVMIGYWACRLAKRSPQPKAA